MPIYEYRCGACGKDFEELVLSVSPEHSSLCPSCGSENVRKKLSCFAGVTKSSSAGSTTAPSPPSCGFS